MTKNPQDVIHEAARVEQYLQCYFEAEGISFDQWITRFGEGIYLQRNLVILRMLQLLQPHRVFEFACAGGFLAKLLLDNLPAISLYTCTNFSSPVVEYCKKQLSECNRFEAALVDADIQRSDDLLRAGLETYDVVVTTSFEHIQHDRELIELLPNSCTFVFSVAAFDDPEHFRRFENEAQIRNRYNDLLDISSIEHPDEGRFVVMARRPCSFVVGRPGDSSTNDRA
jgi:hypothetical protein